MKKPSFDNSEWTEPNVAELAAWENLPRDEQLARLRDYVTSHDATTDCGLTMNEILELARARVAARENA